MYRLRYLPLGVLAVCALLQIVRPLFVVADPVSTDYVEMMVAGAAQRLADGTDLAGIYAPPDAPYHMPGVAYPPLVLLLGAALVKTGVSVLVAMRLICWAGYLLAAMFVGLSVWHETRNRWAAIFAALLPFCFWNVVQYLSGSRVDSVAIALALAGVYCYRRGAPLLLTVLLLTAAFFSKQTMLAAPAAIALDIFLRKPRLKASYTDAEPPSVTGRIRAVLPFVLGMGIAIAATFGLCMLLSDGTLAGIYEGARATRLIPFDKMMVYWFFFVADHLPMLVLAGGALWLRWRAEDKDRFWAFYGGLALLITGVTLLKDGAVDYYFGELCYIIATQVGWLTARFLLTNYVNFRLAPAVKATKAFMSVNLWRMLPILLAVQAVIGVAFVPKGDPAALRMSARGAYYHALAVVRDAQAQQRPSLVLANNLLLATGHAEKIGDYFVYGILLTSGKRDATLLLTDIAAHKYDTIVIETGGFGRYPDAVTAALNHYYRPNEIRGSEPGSIPFIIYS